MAWSILTLDDILNHGLDPASVVQSSNAAALRPPLPGAMFTCRQLTGTPCFEAAYRDLWCGLCRRNNRVHVGSPTTYGVQHPAPKPTLLVDGPLDSVSLMYCQDDAGFPHEATSDTHKSFIGCTYDTAIVNPAAGVAW